jgi:hypothetical protein
MTEFLHLDYGRRIERILDDKRFSLWKSDPEVLRGELHKVQEPYPEVLLKMFRGYAAAVGRPNAELWIDHTPRNLTVAATLAEMFPSSRFIHIVRDGRAVAASILPISWGPNTSQVAAHWWAEQVAFGLALESWAGPKAIRVRYEDVLTDPEQTLRTLASFLGLNYQPEMLRGDGYRPPFDREKIHVLVGRPPQPQRAEAWKQSLTSRDIEIFEWVAADLLRYFGYELMFDVKARPPSSFERLSGALRENLARFVVNPLRSMQA